MAESNQNENVFNENDTLDINELAALNDDISTEFIEQLQNQVSQSADKFNGISPSKKDDTELFEEVPLKKEEQNQTPEQTTQTEQLTQTEQPPKGEKISKVDIDNNIDDNFIKKYKAKLKKQQGGNTAQEEDSELKSRAREAAKSAEPSSEIENLTGGNITEKTATAEQVSYNDSLDFLDDNVKYSKYVIYIDPENTDFIESLTVKERKNLINRILREQDDISMTKRRLGMIQAIIKHTIIAIITIAITIPVIYFTINTSLEATINNYRNSQTIFKTLYKEHGKIQKNY